MIQSVGAFPHLVNCYTSLADVLTLIVLTWLPSSTDGNCIASTKCSASDGSYLGNRIISAFHARFWYT